MLSEQSLSSDQIYMEEPKSLMCTDLRLEDTYRPYQVITPSSAAKDSHSRNL